MLDKSLLLNPYRADDKINEFVVAIKSFLFFVICSIVKFLVCALCLMVLRLILFTSFPFEINVNGFSDFNPMNLFSQEIILFFFASSLFIKFTIKLCFVFAVIKIVMVFLKFCLYYVKRIKQILNEEESLNFFDNLFGYKLKVKFLN